MPNPVVINGVGTTVNERLLAVDNTMIRLAEHVGEFLREGQIRHPSVWRDTIPYGVYEAFNGEAQTTNVFRGTLGEQVGLSKWSKAELSRRGNESGTITPLDACTYNPITYDWAIESMTYNGYRREWKSPVLCIRDMYTVDKAREQLGIILKAGEQVVSDTREIFQREMYIKFASDAGRCLLATSSMADAIDDPSLRFKFDPFAVDSDGDQTIEIPTSALGHISTLNWTFLDFCKEWLQAQVACGAIGKDSGQSVFAAMMDKNEFEKMVYADKELREDFRYAIPQQLISGFDMGFKVYRGIAIIHDDQQPRWSVKSVGETKTVLRRVAPMRAGRVVAVGRVPEVNPEYINAEFGLIVFKLQNVYEILVPGVLTSLGSGTSFGPAPNFNGEWTWLNIQDEVTNPLREKGYFFARFEYHPRPLDNAPYALTILYRRCPVITQTLCAGEEPIVKDDLSTPVTADSFAKLDDEGKRYSVTLPEPAAVRIGTAVTLSDGSNTLEGVITTVAAAPTYTVIGSEGVTLTGTVTVSLTE